MWMMMQETSQAGAWKDAGASTSEIPFTISRMTNSQPQKHAQNLRSPDQLRAPPAPRHAARHL